MVEVYHNIITAVKVSLKSHREDDRELERKDYTALCGSHTDDRKKNRKK